MGFVKHELGLVSLELGFVKHLLGFLKHQLGFVVHELGFVIHKVRTMRTTSYFVSSKNHEEKVTLKYDQKWDMSKTFGICTTQWTKKCSTNPKPCRTNPIFFFFLDLSNMSWDLSASLE